MTTETAGRGGSTRKQNLQVREHAFVMHAHEVLGVLQGRQTQVRRVVTDRNSVGNFKASELRLSDAWVDGSKLKAYLRPDVAAKLGYQPDEIVERLYSPLSFDIDDENRPVAHRLWVRETALYLYPIAGDDSCADIMYADHDDYDICYPDKASSMDLGWRVRPSIHMPRWASRLTLEITGVRVERLQSMGEVDAIAEGVQPLVDETKEGWDRTNFLGAFEALWNSLNAKREAGAYSWDRNPWVWVIGFRPLSNPPESPDGSTGATPTGETPT